MNITTNKTLSEEEVILDYHKYVGCTFEDCVIIYHGNGPTAAEQCEFVNCQFDFRASATATLDTLRSFFHGGLEEVAIDILSSVVAEDKNQSPLRIVEGNDQHRLVLDLGRIDPKNSDWANGAPNA